MSKKSKQARERKERRRARKNLELNKAKAVIDKTQGNPEGNKAEQKEYDLPSVAKATPDRSPAPACQPKETNTSKKRQAPKYIMRPVVAIWRGIKIMWERRAIPFFRFFEQHHGAVTAFATIAIVGLTYEYVQYSKKQWQVAQDTLRVSQGAYVTIGTKDGRVADLLVPQNLKGSAEIVMHFQNSGHVPAKFNWGWLYPPVTIPETPDFPALKISHEWNPMTRTRNRKDNSTQESGAITIAGDSVYTAEVVEMPAERAVKQTVANNVMLLYGAYEYCDTTGNYACRNFQLLYSGNRFTLAMDYECPEFMTLNISPLVELSERSRHRSLVVLQKRCNAPETLLGTNLLGVGRKSSSSVAA